MTALSGTLSRRSLGLIRKSNRDVRYNISTSISSLLDRDRQISPALEYASYQYIQTILGAFGYNSTSYLALESDKKHFFHNSVPAVTAYAEFNKVAITAGEPIASRAQLPTAIDEFLEFTHQQSLRTIFFEVTEPVVPILQERGFQFLKLGEEPFFELNKFILKGNKMANVRSSGNTARNRGVKIREYEPIGSEAPSIDAQLEAISQQWLQTRGISELSFTLGTLSLDFPGDRRYFIAEHNKRVVAFVTYTPIYGRQGFYLDLMRRSDEAPTGTMDLLLSESFLQMAASNVKLVTMGMSPLANVLKSKVPQSQKLSWLLHQFSVRGDAVYKFHQLHEFKRKFQPHFWESKYLAYRHLGIRELDAILQALLHQSIGSLVWWALNKPIF